jgi:hypothetical protein
LLDLIKARPAFTAGAIDQLAHLKSVAAHEGLPWHCFLAMCPSARGVMRKSRSGSNKRCWTTTLHSSATRDVGIMHHYRCERAQGGTIDSILRGHCVAADPLRNSNPNNKLEPDRSPAAHLRQHFQY